MHLIGPKSFFGVAKRQLKKKFQDWESEEIVYLRTNTPTKTNKEIYYQIVLDQCLKQAENVEKSSYCTHTNLH